MSTRWVDRYMGVPYRRSCSSFNGADCWGLYALILLEEKRISYPEIQSRGSLNADRHMISGQIAQGRWIKRWDKNSGELNPSLPEPLDALVMTAPVTGLHTAPLHIACAIGDGKMLQTTPSYGPHVSSIAEEKRRIIGVYRPAKIA